MDRTDLVRLRWRMTGAWLWPGFVLLAISDALDGHWLPPEPDEAEAHYQTVHTHHDQFSVAQTDPGDLSEFGIGFVLYFYAMRALMWTFGALALLSVPVLVFYIYGGGYAVRARDGEGG